MKICFFISTISGKGGTERVTSLIANQLAALGYKITVLSLWDGHNPSFSLDPSIKTSQIFRERVNFSRNYLTGILRLRAFVRNNGFDTLIVSDSILALFSVPALYRSSLKHIVWEHFNYKADYGLSRRRFARTLASQYADIVVTLTRADADLWESKNPKAKVVTINNPSPYPVLCERTWDNKIALAVGRLTYQKGFDQLVECWTPVAEQYPDWQLWILGDGEDKEALEKQIFRNGLSGIVKIFPFTAEIDKYLKAASIFCLSSRFEGLGMVLIEAQSFGLPAVAFDCEVGPAEIIRHGETGFLVETFNRDDFSEKLMILINDKELREEQGKAALEAAQAFQPEHIVPKWLEILGEPVPVEEKKNEDTPYHQ